MFAAQSQECLSYSLEEHGVSATTEQIKAIASDVEISHENYGMAFHIPENPLIGELAEMKRLLKDEREKVFCKYCKGRGRVIDYFGQFVHVVTLLFRSPILYLLEQALSSLFCSPGEYGTFHHGLFKNDSKNKSVFVFLWGGEIWDFGPTIWDKYRELNWLPAVFLAHFLVVVQFLKVTPNVGNAMDLERLSHDPERGG